MPYSYETNEGFESTGKKSHVYIIILNWNGWNDTRECLESLYQSSFKSFTVLLIDNGSQNDVGLIEEWAREYVDYYKSYNTEDAIKKGVYSDDLNKKLVLVKNDRNLGFAKANNVGITIARKDNIPFVFLLNNDTTIDVNAINKLFSFINGHPGYTVVVPQIRYANPSDLIWCCGGYQKNFYEHYYHKGENSKDLALEGVRDITFATGCALFASTEKLGLLSEKFFFGEEDFELSLRLAKEGKKMACVNDALVYHKESASINRTSKNVGKIYIHKLNRLIDIKDYAPLTWPLHLCYRALKFLSLLLVIERINPFKAVKIALKFFVQAVTLKEVNEETFFSILKLKLLEK